MQRGTGNLRRQSRRKNRAQNVSDFGRAMQDGVLNLIEPRAVLRESLYLGFIAFECSTWRIDSRSLGRQRDCGCRINRVLLLLNLWCAQLSTNRRKIQALRCLIWCDCRLTGPPCQSSLLDCFIGIEVGSCAHLCTTRAHHVREPVIRVVLSKLLPEPALLLSRCFGDRIRKS